MPARAIENTGFWYAVRTRSQFEKKAAADMVARGLEAYLPLLTEIRQWTDRRKRTEMPLFPGYLFARFEDTAEARVAVLRSPGVISILGGGGKLAPVPDAEIESVRRLLREAAPCLVHPLLREGSWVRVKRGPLRGVEGLLARFRTRLRLVVSVELLSQSVSAEIDASDVEPVSRPDARRSGLCVA